MLKKLYFDAYTPTWKISVDGQSALMENEGHLSSFVGHFMKTRVQLLGWRRCHIFERNNGIVKWVDKMSLIIAFLLQNTYNCRQKLQPFLQNDLRVFIFSE